MLDIDIVRPTNPSPVFFPLTDDDVALDEYHGLIIKPLPLNICSPRSAMTSSERISFLDALARSKSAPPHPPHLQSSNDPSPDGCYRRSSDEEENDYLVQEVDPYFPYSQHCHHQQQQQQQHAFCSAVMPIIRPSLADCPSAADATETLSVGTFCDTTKQLRQEDPDLHVLIEHPTTTTVLPTNTKMSNVIRVPSLHASEKIATFATKNLAEAQQEEQPTAVSSATASASNSTNTKQHEQQQENAVTVAASNNKNTTNTSKQQQQDEAVQAKARPRPVRKSEGVLVIRPNPIKTTAPPSSAAASGGGGVLLSVASPIAHHQPLLRSPPAPTTTTTTTTIVQPRPHTSQPSPEAKVEQVDLKQEEKKTPEPQQLPVLQEPIIAVPVVQPAAVVQKPKPTQQPVQVQVPPAVTTRASEASRRRDKERRAKKLQAELIRRQEIQCTFPENNNNTIHHSHHQTIANMPESGRDSVVDVQTNNGDSNNGGGNNNNNNSNQQQQPQSQRNQQQQRTSSTGFSIGNRAGNNSNDDNNNDGKPPARTVQQHPTPLFERLVTEEVQELKSYARIIENQNRRLTELERVHGDLEVRLEVETRSREDLEATLEAREREWSDRFVQLEQDRDQWKQKVQLEETKNQKLIDQVVRKDQDIHRMLKKKYDNDGGVPRSVRNVRSQQALERQDMKPSGSAPRMTGTLHRGGSSTGDLQRSPHELLSMRGSAEKVRLRNVEGLLKDFFGI